MGPTRSVVAHHWPDGSTTYFNALTAADLLVDKLLDTYGRPASRRLFSEQEELTDIDQASSLGQTHLIVEQAFRAQLRVVVGSLRFLARGSNADKHTYDESTGRRLCPAAAAASPRPGPAPVFSEVVQSLEMLQATADQTQSSVGGSTDMASGDVQDDGSDDMAPPWRVEDNAEHSAEEDEERGEEKEQTQEAHESEPDSNEKEMKENEKRVLTMTKEDDAAGNEKSVRQLTVAAAQVRSATRGLQEKEDEQQQMQQV